MRRSAHEPHHIVARIHHLVTFSVAALASMGCGASDNLDQINGRIGVERGECAKVARSSCSYVQSLMERRVGYGRDATGGMGGSIYRVTNLKDGGEGSLRAAAESSEKLWIVFDVDGTIRNATPLRVTSNKTIDGRGREITLTHRELQIQNQSNVIVHNIRFDDNGDGDDDTDCCDSISLAAAQKIWIDHCDFREAEDEDIGNWGGPSDVTVSWSHFKRSNHAMLLARPEVRFTLHHNWFELIYGRIPRISEGAWVHSFNNYYDRWVSYNAYVKEGAHFFSKRDIYRAGSKEKDASQIEGGYVRCSEETELNGARVKERKSKSVFQPDYSYEPEMPDRDLISRIEEGAGHRRGVHPLDGLPQGADAETEEQCGNGLDDNADGSVDEGCPCPELGAKRTCYAGPDATRGRAPCKDGLQRCVGDDEFHTWGPCEGAQLPTVDTCNDGVDQDCNGEVDDGPGCWNSHVASGGNPNLLPGYRSNSGSLDWRWPGSAPDCAPEQTGCGNGDDYVIGRSGSSTGGHGDDYVIGRSGSSTGGHGDDYVIGRSGSSTGGQGGSGAGNGQNVELYDLILYGASFKDRVCRVGPTDLPIFEQDCDVFAQVAMAGQLRKTKTEDGDSSPVWNQLLFRLERDDLLGKPISIAFKDSDFFGDDDLRSCVRQFTEKHLADGRAVFTNCGKATSVIFLLK
jgi:pectate lyase